MSLLTHDQKYNLAEARAKAAYAIMQAALVLPLAWEQLEERERAAWREVADEFGGGDAECNECGSSLQCVICDDVSERV